MALIEGHKGADKLIGTAFDDTILGRYGDDRLSGDDGNDRIEGGAGKDGLRGGDGNDHLSGGQGADKAWGGGGKDVLRGGAGDDVLGGGGGADTLIGGDGADTLYGGGGDDVFVVLQSDLDLNIDTFADFVAGEDVIDVRAVDANEAQTGDQAFDRVDAFNGQAGQLVLSYDAVNDRTTALFDTDGDMVADLQVLIDGAVTDASFLL